MKRRKRKSLICDHLLLRSLTTYGAHKDMFVNSAEIDANNLSVLTSSLKRGSQVFLNPVNSA